MLTVVSIGYPLATVGPDAIGGAEQVVSAIDAALVDAGHRSIVIAPHGSVCRGELRELPPPEGSIDVPAIYRAHDACRAALRRVLADEHVDVLHFHGVDAADYMPETDLPILVTLHMWPDAYPRRLFASTRPNVLFQCVSAAQRRACPTARPPLLIRNGVDLRRLAPEETKDRFVLALGRICPEKAFHVAIDAAKAAGVPIRIGGAVFPYEAHRRYFDEAIAPRLDERTQFLGPLTGRVKRRLLATARCLVVSSRVPETSSLAAMEALACGTPVVAARTPALEELIEDGRTGWLVDSPGRMVRAIQDVERLSPLECRCAAEARCSAESMLTGYLECYDALTSTAHRTARAARATAVEVLESAAGLETIRDEWIALANECPPATPFQRPEWLIAWVRHWSTVGSLRCVAIREAGRLVAVVPFHVIANGRTVLELAGGAVSDYLGGTIASDRLALVSDALSSALGHELRGWDRLELRQLHRDDPLLSLPLHGVDEIREADSCPAIGRGGVPARMLGHVRYYTRRAARRGRVEFQVATDESLPEMVDALFRLHAARWSRRGAPGVLADPSVRAFHAEAMPALQRAGRLALHAVRIDGRIVAVAYGLRDAARLYYYLGGFDPEFADVSPGTLALADAIDAAWRGGAREVDFLRGRERYKYWWGAADRASFERFATNPAAPPPSAPSSPSSSPLPR